MEGAKRRPTGRRGGACNAESGSCRGSVLIDPRTIESLADTLAEKLAERLFRLGAEDAWLTSAEAAKYLAMPISTLRKLTAAGSIPFSQDVVGGRCYFKRSELDRWRREGSGNCCSGEVPSR